MRRYLLSLKERYGPLTKIGGIFSYTKWIPQHRSKVEYHELEYNLALLKLLGVRDDAFDTTLELPVPRANVSQAFDKLKAMGFDAPEHGYFVIHPCSGGSAKNWRYSYYAELANRLCKTTELPLVLTGIEQDSKVLASIKQHIKGRVYNTAGSLSLMELVALISEARLFVGPSTGPMHIAVATGVPVASIFSPVKVQSARRWGPYSFNKSVVIAPAVNDCPGKLKCIGHKCEHYDCMNSIEVDEVFEKAKKIYDDSLEQMGLSFAEV